MYKVKKHRKTTKPMMSQLVCNMVTNQNADTATIKLATGATTKQIHNVIAHYQPKPRKTDAESVCGLNRLLLSRPMSEWKSTQTAYQNL